MAKLDNAPSGYRAKVSIRRQLLDLLTPAETHVFDAFAGKGVMWADVWKDAASYVGCDEKWHRDPRCCYVGDNHRVMRAIDLYAFNCFDFDAYGSPWDQLTILAARRPMRTDEQIGVVFTDGTWMKSRCKMPVGAFTDILGTTRLSQPITANTHTDLIRRAFLRCADRMGAEVRRYWIAVGTTGMRVRYVGALLTEKKRPAANVKNRRAQPQT